MTTILDPTNEARPVERQLSARNGAVTGVVGLLDIRKPRGDIFLNQLDKQLKQQLPGVEIRRYTKPTFTKPCPDDLRHQIKEECDFVVEALAD
jgi:riboflavin synthase